MTIVQHPAALKMAAERLGDTSCDLRAALAQLQASIDASALDAEFKQTVVEGLDKWMAQLDRLIPHFRAQAAVDETRTSATRSTAGWGGEKPVDKKM